VGLDCAFLWPKRGFSYVEKLLHHVVDISVGRCAYNTRCDSFFTRALARNQNTIRGQRKIHPESLGENFRISQFWVNFTHSR